MSADELQQDHPPFGGIQHPQIQCKKLIPTNCHTSKNLRKPTSGTNIRTPCINQHRSQPYATINIQQNHHQSPFSSTSIPHFHHHKSPHNSPSFSLSKGAQKNRPLSLFLPAKYCQIDVQPMGRSRWPFPGHSSPETKSQRRAVAISRTRQLREVQPCLNVSKLEAGGGWRKLAG